MDFGLAFTYVFKDPNWVKKVLLAALVTLIPIVGQLFILGWSLEIARRVIQGDPEPLPDLNLGANIGRGFKAMVIALVYAIPVFIVSIPLIIAQAVFADGSSDVGNAVILALSVCTGLIAFLYGIFMAFMWAAAQGNFASEDVLKAGLRFKDVFALVKAAPVAYLLVIAGGFLTGIIAPLGSIACAVGALATAAYASAVNGHLIGQAFREAKAKLGTPVM